MVASSFFITSSGTEIGKTFLTAALTWQLRGQGVPVRAIKPVLSGYEYANKETSDAGVLLHSAGIEPTDQAIEQIAPWRFRAPLSPHMAAAAEDKEVDFSQLVGWCRKQQKEWNGCLLIEGVGGVMAPLNRSYTVLDWIKALRCPAILVVGSYLGALSHAFTAAEVLRTGQMPIQAVVVSESEGSSVDFGATVDTLRDWFARHNTPVIALPRVEAHSQRPYEQARINLDAFGWSGTWWRQTGAA